MSDQFTMLSDPHHATVFDDYVDQRSAKFAEPDVSILASIRHHHPDMTVAVTVAQSFNFLGFAAAGYATAELDLTEDAIIRIRGYMRPQSEEDPGSLYDGILFARYKYTWKNLEFILYTARIGLYIWAYVLFPPDSDETVLSNSKATNALLLAVGQAQYPYSDRHDYILVFDGRWYQSSQLYYEVQKTSWDDVILDEAMKNTLTHTIEEFFDNESKYKDLDVPWKRGVIFYGPPGNGKTLSLRALMHALSARQDRRQRPINLLYVKSITNIYAISTIFQVARAYSPCLLILEDIDTLVSGGFQSYFFNEVDGLENNDGIMMIATTNHLERLDGGIANRPSRFDRKYNFPDPDYDERVMYSEFWRKKLENKAVEFPKELSPEIAKITQDFSFAYMKEAFVATLLAMARAQHDAEEDGGNEIHDLPFWKEMQKEVKILRDEMKAKKMVPRPAPGATRLSNTYHQEAQAARRNTLQPIGGVVSVEQPLPFQSMGFNPPPVTNAPHPQCPPLKFPDLQPLSVALPPLPTYGPTKSVQAASKSVIPFPESAATELHHRLHAFDSTTGFSNPSSPPVISELPSHPFHAMTRDDGSFTDRFMSNVPTSELYGNSTTIGAMQGPCANASNQALQDYQMQLMQGPNAASRNHSLQDYQMQLMLLEQQNKKRLMMARQQQDSVAGDCGSTPAQPGTQLPGMCPLGSGTGTTPLLNEWGPTADFGPGPWEGE